MNRRIEQRFQVYSPAKVILLDDPERELVCSLTDISAAGVRLLSDEPLPPDGMIVVEAEGHLVLCDVRNSQARGTRFTVGAERVHTLSTLDLPPDSTVLERIQALINDYHLRLRGGLAISEPEHSVAYPVEETLPEPEPVVEPVRESPKLLSTEPFPYILPRPRPALPRPPVPAFLHVAETFEVAPEIVIQPSPEPVAVVAEVVPEPARIPQVVPEEQSKELPVELEPAVQVDMAALASWTGVARDQKRILRTWSIVIGVMAGLVVLGAEALYFGPSRVQAQMSPAVARPDEAAALPKPGDVPPFTDPDPEPAPAVPVIQVAHPSRRASITATEPTWITACIDGQMVLSKLIVAHETQEIQYSKVAMLRFGNAGGVQLTVNGEATGPIGAPGMVRVVELTPEGLSFLPVSTDAAACQAAARQARQ